MTEIPGAFRIIIRGICQRVQFIPRRERNPTASFEQDHNKNHYKIWRQNPQRTTEIKSNQIDLAIAFQFFQQQAGNQKTGDYEKDPDTKLAQRKEFAHRLRNEESSGSDHMTDEHKSD